MVNDLALNLDTLYQHPSATVIVGSELREVGETRVSLRELLGIPSGIENGVIVETH